MGYFTQRKSLILKGTNFAIRIARKVMVEDGIPAEEEYKSCAIQQFARQIGAEEMGPYVCLFDIGSSEAFGWGLKRTQTIGQGCTSCDFEFKRGAPTRVHLPEELGLGK